MARGQLCFAILRLRSKLALAYWGSDSPLSLRPLLRFLAGLGGRVLAALRQAGLLPLLLPAGPPPTLLSPAGSGSGSGSGSASASGSGLPASLALTHAHAHAHAHAHTHLHTHTHTHSTRPSSEGKLRLAFPLRVLYRLWAGRSAKTAEGSGGRGVEYDQILLDLLMIEDESVHPRIKVAVINKLRQSYSAFRGAL